jgi:very-short-patch-repair endonuclease
MDEQLDPHATDRRIAELAAAGHNVLALAELRAAGLGYGQIQVRLSRGSLYRMHRGVYGVGHPRQLGALGRWRAAVLACGDGGVLSHRSSAALWGLRRSGAGAVDVTVRSHAGRSPPAGVRVHRRRAPLPATEITRRQGVPVTTPARTLLDLAEVLPRRALERATDEAERLRLFDLRELEIVLRGHPRHAGRNALAAELEEHDVGTTLTRNDLEEAVLALCRARGLPAPDVNAQVGPYEADFLWREERLIVEADGRASHATRRAFEHDRARDARLTVAGYRVVRFSHRQVMREPAVVAGLLLPLLCSDQLRQ